MWNLIKGLLTSKKAAAMLAGLIVAGAGKIGLDLPTETVGLLLAPILVYIFGQGQADSGKEAAKVEAIADASSAKEVEKIKAL